jgi:Tol biopolymer transport system component
MWAYLTGRFGDRLMAEILSAESGGFEKRIRAATGVELEQLFDDWRATSHETLAVKAANEQGDDHSPIPPGSKAGRVQLGPSLSPNGREVVLFSERDRLSLDLFLADAATGAIVRKLATTTATARFESLQPIRSAGSWSPAGDRFVFSAISHGRPALVILDVSGRAPERQIALPQLGEILTPAWSPDGRAIAFAALEGGGTELYVYDLDGNTLRQLTSDQFSDLQPAWSPDGRSIAFTTDRFTTDQASLTFGASQLAILDVFSGAIRTVGSFGSAKAINPQWSQDGGSLYFLSDPEGVTNIYRVELDSGGVFQVSHSTGGVAGLTATSPALSVARDSQTIAFTVYRRGSYVLDIVRGDSNLAGRSATGGSTTGFIGLPPIERLDGELAALAPDYGLPAAEEGRSRAYPTNLFVESIGQPYLSSGGGPFGTFVRGGGSLLFSDMLGERKLGVAVQIGNRLRELGLAVQYLNRERRWNWGAVAELQPSIRALPHQRMVEHAGQPGVSLETHYFEQMQMKVGGIVAYPLSQAQRFEFGAGVRHTRYRQTLHSTVRSLATGRVIDRATTTGFGGAPSSVGEVTAALVGDTALFGATSPIVGGRYRFELASALGNMSFVRTLLDHRRYFMPVKPYTIATRVVHVGQYGRDADDPRLQPAFLGSRQFVHGYGWGSLRCDPAVANDCNVLERLLGNRLLAGSLELRFPVMGVLSREIRYGPAPIDGFLFADAGLVWSRSVIQEHSTRKRSLVSSVGAGVRVNALGLPLEFAAVRALNAPADRWSFDFSLRTGF